jgi:small subunit ribosomal protein S1
VSSKETRLRRPGEEAEAAGEEGAPGATSEGVGAPPGAPAAGEAPREAKAAPAAAPDDDDEGLDFATLLEQAGNFDAMDLRVGDRVTTRLISVGREDAFFDLGPAQDGVMSRGELVDEHGELTVAVGDELELFVASLGATVTLSRRMGHGADLIGLEAAFKARMPVVGKVTGVNKGGLDVEIGGTRAFCRMGQIDIQHVEDPTSLVGQKLTFLIAELKEGGKNIVVSRRAVLEEERKKAASLLLETLEVGQVREGTVSRILDFGAFVDVGGIDGLVPLSELSWGHVTSPDEVVSVGDRVTVEVRRIEADPKRKGEMRLSLSLRTSDNDPWNAHVSALVPGATLQGKVQRTEPFGAFVELRDGIVGLVHISELSTSRVRHPDDVVKVGDTVSVRILELDQERRRLSLSLREKVEAGDLPVRGTRTVGTVTRIESYGVFVDLKEGGSALLPAAESGTPPGTDLRRALPIGATVEVMITEVDDKGRMKVSHTALGRADEAQALAEHRQDAPAGGGLGTFADLFNKQRQPKKR